MHNVVFHTINFQGGIGHRQFYDSRNKGTQVRSSRDLWIQRPGIWELEKEQLIDIVDADTNICYIDKLEIRE